MNTRIPQYQPRLGQFSRTNVASGLSNSDGISSGLSRIGQGLIRRAAEENRVKGQEEGALDQMNAGGDELVQRDGGFLGLGVKTRAYNEGARLTFANQKRQEIDIAAAELSQQFQYDPDGFKEAWTERKQELYEGVPGEVRPGIELYGSGKSADTVLSLTEDRIKRDRTVHLDTLGLERSDFLKRAEMEISKTGALSDVIEAEFYALKDRFTEMDVLPSEVALLDEGFEMAQTRGVIDNAFETSTNKPEFIENVLSDDGPAGHLPQEERNKIARLYGARLSQQNAQRTAQVKIYESQLDEAIRVETGGKRYAGTISLLEASRGFPEAADKITKLGRLAAAREEIDAAYQIPVFANEENLAKLRQKESTVGVDPYEAALIDGLETVVDKQREAQEEGNQIELIEDRFGVGSRMDDTGALIDPEQRLMIVEGINSEEEPRNRTAFYSAAEMDRAGKVFQYGSVGDRLTLLNNWSQQTPPDQIPLVMQRMSQIAPEFTMVFNLHQKGEDRVVQSVLSGRDFYEANKSAFPPKTELVQSIHTLVSRYYPRTVGAKERAALVDTIFYKAVDDYSRSIANSGGSVDAKFGEKFLTQDSDLAARAVGDVLGFDGLNPPTINDRFVMPFQRGMKNDRVEKYWSWVDDSILSQMHTEPPVTLAGTLSREVTAEEIAERGWPIQLQDGVFGIMMEGADINGTDEPVMLYRIPAGGGTPVPFTLPWDMMKKSIDQRMSAVGATMRSPARGARPLSGTAK